MIKEDHSFSIYHIDTFTDQIFSGNPAAVCLLPKSLPDTVLQTIAKQNNLPVTAFLSQNNDVFVVRWFTPDYELEMCGHGALAAAYVIFHYLEPTWQKVQLQSRSESLLLERNHDFIVLALIAKLLEVAHIENKIEPALEIKVEAIYQSQHERCIVILQSEIQVKQLTPNISMLKQLPYRGITVTAPGDQVDFVSRTFYPNKNMVEDAVTGAVHSWLVPYWAKRLGKTKLHARQLSSRGGELICQYQADRVLIAGRAVLYSQGHILLSQSLVDAQPHA